MQLSGRFKPYNGRRLQLVVGLFGLSFCAILIRLVIVQVFLHAYLLDLAARQYSRNITLVPSTWPYPGPARSCAGDERASALGLCPAAGD